MILPERVFGSTDTKCTRAGRATAGGNHYRVDAQLGGVLPPVARDVASDIKVDQFLLDAGGELLVLVRSSRHVLGFGEDALARQQRALVAEEELEELIARAHSGYDERCNNDKSRAANGERRTQ